MAPAVYRPIPLNESRVSSSAGSCPPYVATASRAMLWRRRGRMLYPSGYHVLTTSRSGAAASAANVGYLASHSSYFGSTRSTCVCCSMISDTRMWYGSSVLRHGRSRPYRRYHVSRRWRKRRRSGGGGIGRGRGLGIYSEIGSSVCENLHANGGFRRDVALRRRARQEGCAPRRRLRRGRRAERVARRRARARSAGGRRRGPRGSAARFAGAGGTPLGSVGDHLNEDP